MPVLLFFLLHWDLSAAKICTCASSEKTLTATTTKHSERHTLTLLHPFPHILRVEVRLSAVWGSRPAFPLGWHPAHVNSPLSSKATNAGPGADSVLTMSYYLPAVAPPVRLPVPLKNRSVAGAKVNLAVRLHWRLPPRPCVTENRLRGINTAASGSVDRGVCVCVCASV